MFKKEFKEDSWRDTVNDLVYDTNYENLSKKKKFRRPPQLIKLGDISSNDEIKFGDFSLDDQWILEGI